MYYYYAPYDVVGYRFSLKTISCVFHLNVVHFVLLTGDRFNVAYAEKMVVCFVYLGYRTLQFSFKMVSMRSGWLLMRYAHTVHLTK